MQNVFHQTYTPKRVSRMTVLHIFADLIWNYLENVMEGVKNETWQCPEDGIFALFLSLCFNAKNEKEFLFFPREKIGLY